MHEDNIRPQLMSAIQGLGACNEAILKEARGAWRRRRDKEAAVKAFSITLNELKSLLERLTSNFYPGGSGMGVTTLVPICKLTRRVRDDIRSGHYFDVQLTQEELDELIRQALRDDSHEEWARTNAKVEALVAELQLAFSVKIN